MARPGPVAKGAKHGHGGAEFVEVPNVPYDGPCLDLPEDVPGLTWFPQVRGWWDVVVTMPHCVLWEAADWLFALDTAYMKQDYWSEYFGGTVHATKATEIRRREDQMGMTMEARRKLGIRYVDPKPEPEVEPAPGEPAGVEQAKQQPAGSNVTSLASRRKRIVSAG